MALRCQTDDDQDDWLTPPVEADRGEVSGPIESIAFREGCIVSENMTFTKRMPATLFRAAGGFASESYATSCVHGGPTAGMPLVVYQPAENDPA